MGTPSLARVADDLVVHVGDVHDPRHAQALEEQHAAQQVGKDEGAEVAHVGGGVDGRAAGVHADVSRLERLERLQAATEGVAEAQAHRDARVTRQVALMARPAPSSPDRLPVMALTETRLGGAPVSAAMAAAMASSRRPPRCGRAPRMVASRLSTARPAAARRAMTSVTSARLSTPRVAGCPGREEPAQVTLSGCRQQPVAQRVEEDVAIRVTVQPRSAVDEQPPEAQAITRAEGVAVRTEGHARPLILAGIRLGVLTGQPASQAEVLGERDLDVGRLALHDVDDDAVAGQELGLVRELFRTVRVSLHGGQQEVAPGCLRRLRPGQAGPIGSAADAAALDALDGVGHGQGGDDGAVTLCALHHAGDERGRDEWACRVMDEHDVGARGPHPCRHGVLAAPSAANDVGAEAAEPVGLAQLCLATGRGDDDDIGDLRCRGQRFHGPAQDRPARDQRRQLVCATHASAAARRHHDGVSHSVSCHRASVPCAVHPCRAGVARPTTTGRPARRLAPQARCQVTRRQPSPRRSCGRRPSAGCA